MNPDELDRTNLVHGFEQSDSEADDDLASEVSNVSEIGSLSDAAEQNNTPFGHNDDESEVYWDLYVDEVAARQINIRKFNVTGHQTTFTISDALGAEEDVCYVMERLMQRLINRAIANAQEEGFECSQIGLAFYVEGMNDGEFLIPFRPPDENTAEKLTVEMDKFHQSNKEISLFEKAITMNVTVVRTPVGAGKRKLSIPLNYSNVNPNAILQIPYFEDTLCLFRALLIASRHVHLVGDRNYTRSMKRYLTDRVFLTQETIKFMFRLNMQEEEGRRYYGLHHVRLVQERMNQKEPGKYNILVFGRLYGEKPAFNGRVNAEHVLTLYHANGHFDAATTPAQLLGKRYYCTSCECTYSHENKHTYTCKYRCSVCMRHGYGYPEKCQSLNRSTHRECPDCNVWFQTMRCFQTHKQNSTCKTRKRCTKCGVIYSTQSQHRCNEFWCDVCKRAHSKGECAQTFMEPIPKIPKQDYRIVAYDYECTIDEPFGPQRFRHNVNAVSAKVTCTKCIEGNKWNNLQQTDCPICGPMKVLYWSVWDCENPLDDFVEFLFRGMPKSTAWHKYRTFAYAHNAAKYDTHFTLQNIYSRGGVEPRIVTSGNKIFQVHVPKTRTTAEVNLRDSNLLFPMKLDNAVTTFDLKGIDNKSHFPYKFNREENYDVVLPHLPPKEDYIPSRLSKEERKKFDTWYDANFETEFNLRQVIKEYCESDSLILLHALVTFRHLFNDIAGADLFIRGITITSLCLRLFKYKYLKRDHIPIVPTGGYGRADRQSRIALQWLKWLAHSHGVGIRHRDSEEGEERIGEFRVDGYIKLEDIRSPAFHPCKTFHDKYRCFLCAFKEYADRDLVVEFHGCPWHGCQHCYKNNVHLPCGHSASDALKLTQERERRIVELAHVEYWSVQECIVRKELRKNVEMKNFFDSTFDTGPLDPRCGFFGGRVHPTRMYYKANPDEEEIKYFDIVSLYPYVLCNKMFPVGGEPERIFSCPGAVSWCKSQDLPFRGLYKVRVLPPDNLPFPVLAFRDDHRLLFPLCAKCAILSRNVDPYREPGCDHSRDERAFVSTTTDAELAEALDSGYRVLDFVEGWKYEEWDGDLFKGYMKEFLRLKIEASGWSHDVINSADVDKAMKETLENYLNYQGLDVRKEKVCKNPGLRYIAKLCANSLWGRFAMRVNKQQVEIVRSPARLNDLLAKKSVDVTSIIELNDETLRVSYQYVNRFEKMDPNNNLVLAMYTTAYGRLELLKYMRQCEEDAGGAKGAKLLYNDTDSVTAVFRRGNIPICTGERVGDMCDEYPNHTITEFISGGSKNYGLQMCNKTTGAVETKQKIRGITFNSDTQKLLTYAKQKECIQAQPNRPIVEVPNSLILRNNRSDVYTCEGKKRYRVYVRKAWIDESDPSFRNYPYGYNKPLIVGPPKKKKLCLE